MAGKQKVNWMEMFPDEFFDARNDCPVCYMTYGPAEPHGVYNAMGMDWIKIQGMLELAAQAHGGIVAPPYAWHIQEQQYYDWELGSCGMGMSITSSLPEDLFLHNILYHIRNMDGKGFHAGILISGHCLGHLGADMRLLCDYYRRFTHSPIQLYAGTSDEIETIKRPEKTGGHAGVYETCSLMALRPELVDLERLNKPLNVPESIAGGNEKYGPYCAPKDFGRNGVTPTAEFGRKIVDSLVESVGIIKTELLDKYKPVEGWKAPSIIDTEAIWTRFVQLTRKYWQCVLTEREAEENIYPVFPGWEELGE